MAPMSALDSGPLRLVLVEDDARDAELVRSTVVAEWPEARIEHCRDAAGLEELLASGSWDLVLSDLCLAGWDGMDALRLVRRARPGLPFIFVSGAIGEERAVEAIRSGAQDCVGKDRLRWLPVAIRRALKERADAARREASERRLHEFREMLNQCREAMIVSDLDSRVVYWNAGAAQLFGWSAADVLGRQTFDIFPPALAAHLREATQATLANGWWRGELQLADRQGRPVLVETRRSLIRDEEGRPVAQLSLSLDISERRRLEDRLMRTQRMENIAMLATGFALELNNVLAPILLASPILRDRAESPQERSLLELVEQSAERGANLVREIRNFGRVAPGEDTLVDARAILREIGHVVRGSFPTAIDFGAQVPSELWRVRMSPANLYQLVLNLCVNARDAMPSGGHLRVTAANCRLGNRDVENLPDVRPGLYVRIEVQDTGSGIAPEVLERIWEPFFTTKKAGRGTGLGLSTVRAIVRHHGGAVSVDTRMGEGSRFRVLLPAVEAELKNEAVSPVRAGRGDGQLILVVDDEEGVRQVAAATLRRAGYRVAVASDGAEAVAVFADRGHEIAAVVSDTHMPRVDGYTLTRVLKRMDAAVPILAISGMSGSSGGEHPAARSESPDGFLRKPFGPEALLESVEQLLRHKSAE